MLICGVFWLRVTTPGAADLGVVGTVVHVESPSTDALLRVVYSSGLVARFSWNSHQDVFSDANLYCSTYQSLK